MDDEMFDFSGSDSGSESPGICLYFNILLALSLNGWVGGWVGGWVLECESWMCLLCGVCLAYAWANSCLPTLCHAFAHFFFDL
jgi:hypothetical protein